MITSERLIILAVICNCSTPACIYLNCRSGRSQGKRKR